MPEHLFGVSLRPCAVTRQGVTDTAAPPTSCVPSYYIHSFEQPFCADARCACHTQQQEVVRLFVTIIEGRMQLEPAAALLAENGKERHA
jgi:hypothetical protein